MAGRPFSRSSALDIPFVQEPAMKHPLESRSPTGAGTSALALLLALAGCGGGGEWASESTSAPTSSGQAVGSKALLADDGAVLATDPDSVPLDHGAHTRMGRYAQREQAIALERKLRGGVIWVPVECCGSEAVELAVWIAYGMQAAHDLPSSAPIFVSGADLRLAAVVANRLSDHGMSRVFLLTPPRTVARPAVR